MRPQRFPQANRLLGPPADMRDNCVALSVYADEEQLISMWQPDDDDLARLQAGGAVWLYVVGVAHPPVLVTTENPFNETATTKGITP